MIHTLKNFQIKIQLSLILICCLVISACVGGLGSGGDTLPPASDPIVASARDAWDNYDMQLAENLYGKAARLSLPVAEQNEAWERLAMAAALNGRPNSSLDALDQWVLNVPGVDATQAWQDTWLSSVKLLSPSLAIKRAERAWMDQNRSAAARAQAAIILMGRSWSPELSIRALSFIAEYYEKKDFEQKQKIENFTAEEMRYMTGLNLSALSNNISFNTELSYPATVILLENLRRGLPTSAEVEARLNDVSFYADQTLPSRLLASKVVSVTPASVATTTEVPTLQSTCIALALPNSGNIVSITYKIRTGADIAKAELESQGVNVQIEHIDTTQANWLAQLQSLPPQCAVVGGPLQAVNYEAAKQAQITTNRHFFTFLPVISNQEEGNVAWRFFPSPQDQINSLLTLTGELGIISYGSFYPEDNYGTRMNSIFDATVKSMGGNVHAVGYQPANVAQWTAAAETLLRPDDVNNVPLSTATFEAVFLPDSWKNMDMVTAAFLYNGDDKQVLLGTSLWEQSLMTNVSTANTANYKLAVFPGAWNPAQTPDALASTSNVNFWTGLGYDFVRFGAALGMQQAVSALDLNNRLQVAQNMQWSMAPMSYDAYGKASQKLFVFTLTSGGISLADPDFLNKMRLQAISEFEKRKQAAINSTPE